LDDFFHFWILEFVPGTHFSFSFFDHPPSIGQVPSAVRGTPNVPSCDGVHYTFAGPTKVNHVTYWTKSDVIRPSQSNTFGTAVFFVREHYYYLLSGKLFFFAKGLRLLFLLLALTVQYFHTPVLCALCSVLCALCSVLCALCSVLCALCCVLCFFQRWARPMCLATTRI
jgi:hypothetical protein